MKLKPIKKEQDYRKALERLEVIFDAPIETKEGDEAEILSLLIENHENEHFPIEAPDPIEAIKIRMEELNMRQKDLVGVIGGKSRVSEIMNRKKRLTVDMMGIGKNTSNFSLSSCKQLSACEISTKGTTRPNMYAGLTIPALTRFLL